MASRYSVEEIWDYVLERGIQDEQLTLNDLDKMCQSYFPDNSKILKCKQDFKNEVEKAVIKSFNKDRTVVWQTKSTEDRNVHPSIENAILYKRCKLKPDEKSMNFVHNIASKNSVHKSILGLNKDEMCEVMKNSMQVMENNTASKLKKMHDRLKHLKDSIGNPPDVTDMLYNDIKNDVVKLEEQYVDMENMINLMQDPSFYENYEYCKKANGTCVDKFESLNNAVHNIDTKIKLFNQYIENVKQKSKMLKKKKNNSWW